MSIKTLAVLCLPILLAVSVKAQVSAGISITDDGVKSFYLAVGQTYHTTQQEVVVVHERRIPDDEIPVVFFIADRAHVRPEAVVDLRLSGKSWMDITLYYHMNPSIFYIALNGDPGPEYGRVYGYWQRPRSEWNSIRLEDDDVVKMVNLQFVSTHYSVKPEEVVRLRGEQGNFVKVTYVVSRPDYQSGSASKKQDNGQGSDKGHGKEKGNGHKGNNH